MSSSIFAVGDLVREIFDALGRVWGKDWYLGLPGRYKCESCDSYLLFVVWVGVCCCIWCVHEVRCGVDHVLCRLKMWCMHEAKGCCGVGVR